MKHTVLLLSSYTCRFFMVLLIWVFIQVKANSMSGFRSVTPEFLLILVISAMCFVLLSAYHYCSAKFTVMKERLRKASMILLIAFALQQMVLLYAFAGSMVYDGELGGFIREGYDSYNKIILA